MKVIRYYETGGPNVLKYEDSPTPEPGPDQLLVKLAGVSVNFADVGRRRGTFPLPPGVSLPVIPGGECAGVVEAAGSDVTGFKKGDSVFTRAGSPGYAEYAVVDAAQAFPAPSALSLVEAASIGTSFATAWQVVANRAKVQPGEQILVQACASGVGIAIVQVAKYLGATVIGTASTDEKLEWAKEYGLDHGINYETKELVDEVKALTDGKGVPVVIDGVGGDVFLRGLKVLQPYGRMAVYGVASGRRSVEVVLPELWFTNLTVLGAGGSIPRDQADALFAKFDDGTFRATVDRTWPLAQAAEAHRYLEERKVRGKVALTVE